VKKRGAKGKEGSHIVQSIEKEKKPEEEKKERKSRLRNNETWKPQSTYNTQRGTGKRKKSDGRGGLRRVPTGEGRKELKDAKGRGDIFAQAAT